MGKWFGKILFICGILLLLDPSLLDTYYLQNKVTELTAKWQIVLIVIGFFLMNSKRRRKSHR